MLLLSKCANWAQTNNQFGCPRLKSYLSHHQQIGVYALCGRWLNRYWERWPSWSTHHPKSFCVIHLLKTTTLLDYLKCKSQCLHTIITLACVYFVQLSQCLCLFVCLLDLRPCFWSYCLPGRRLSTWHHSLEFIDHKIYCPSISFSRWGRICALFVSFVIVP